MYEDEHKEIELPSIDQMGDIKQDFYRLVKCLKATCGIDQNLYLEYDVKRGLRDSAGKGVLTGLTEISAVVA